MWEKKVPLYHRLGLCDSLLMNFSGEGLCLINSWIVSVQHCAWHSYIDLYLTFKKI